MPSSRPFSRSQPLAVAMLAFLLALAAVAEDGPRGGLAREAGGEILTDAPAAMALPVADARGPEDGGDAAEPPSLAAIAEGTERLALADAPDGGGQVAVTAGGVPEGSPYPHPVQFLTVRVAGAPQRLAFMDVSPSAASAGVNGRTALLIHGADLGGDSWAPTIAVLADAGYRVIVPDLVGFGRSGRPDGQLSLDAQAAHVALLLDSLGAPGVTVVGHALGAAVTTRLAARLPERVHGVVLAAPLGPEHGAASWAPVGGIVGAEPAYEPAYELAGLDVPALVVAGDRDEVAPARSGLPSGRAYRDRLQAAVTGMRRAALVTLPGVGHLPQLEAPEDFHALLLDFLER